jgi:hypothetical protein
MRKHFDRPELFDKLDSVPSETELRRESVTLQSAMRKVFTSQTQIAKQVELYWDPHAIQIPQSYGLIKLHKEPKKLRIITPVVNWLNLKAAKWVAKRLQPYVDELPHVLSNSMSLAKDLTALDLPANFLVSYDVSDMYNSINQRDCLIALEELALVKGWWNTSMVSDKMMWEKTLMLIEWVFNTSLVGFGGCVYKQKRGLPMDSPLSPVLANLYMAYLEYKVMNGMLYEDAAFCQYFFFYYINLL